jgi:hypothetical protein
VAWPRRLPVLSRPSLQRPRELSRRSDDDWRARLAEREVARRRVLVEALLRLAAAS